MLSRSLIQFSVDEWCYIPSLLFDLRPNYGGGNEDNGDLLQKVPCTCTGTLSVPNHNGNMLSLRISHTGLYSVCFHLYECPEQANL